MTKQKRIATLIVDLPESYPEFYCGRGPSQKGYQVITRVLEKSLANGVPTIASINTLSLPSHLEPYILQDLIIPKCCQGSAFRYDGNESRLSEVLNSLSITELFIGGFDRNWCVWATISDALSKGYRVKTCESVLFSSFSPKSFLVREEYYNTQGLEMLRTIKDVERYLKASQGGEK